MIEALSTDGLADRRLASIAFERLLAMVISGELPAGAQLQERRLADLMDMSRTPVREALNKLESDGIVERAHGRLLQVRDIPVREIIEVLHIRRVLEGEGARLAASRMNAATIDRLRRSLQELQREAEPESENHWRVDDDFHNSIAAATGNAMLMQMVQNLRLKTRIFNTRQLPERRDPGAQEHLTILDAIADHDETKARKAMERHIENVKHAILRKLGEI
ncbi:GntR family transcriptional regulator [Telmatospirillum sp. J64-1]|uniref:GntR family transcriptional regulator n=1 Tax=Telmatospirillum sp. J64-1 TaxID=2502183 RepID=UPI00163D9A71|nr:GntR family transcriptional regulator [Telmatospirillum sp. J64-1]